LYNATLAVSNNATVMLQPTDSFNYEHGFIGTLNGIGGGSVFWKQGEIWCAGWDLDHSFHYGLTLNFPGNMLQWSGGCFASGGPVTNVGAIHISTTNAWLFGVKLRTPDPTHGFSIAWNIPDTTAVGPVLKINELHR
jgi:hypothetical protein